MVQKGFSEMMPGVWRLKGVRIAGLAIVSIIVLFWVFHDSSIAHNPFGPGGPSLSGITHSPPPGANGLANMAPQDLLALVTSPPKATPLLNINDYDFNGPYIGWPLSRVCNETRFQPGLTYVCDNNSGGVGNIRNFILTCIRYAIDAGATGVIMPRIQRRSEENLANIFTTGFQPFDYFFDPEHFRYAMSTYCPQMVVYDDIETIPYAEMKTKIEEFYPKDLNMDTDGCDGRGVNRHLDMFRAKFDGYLNKTERVPRATAPVTVRFKWACFFEWPIFRDGPEFAATFGDLLRIRKDIQNLAAETIDEMSKFVGVKPDASRKTLHAPYLGVHLRTESDALGFWPNYEEQTTGYLKTAELHELKHAYLACGNITEAHRFGEMAYEKQKVNITSKMDLLKGDSLKALTDLSWDQQALIDFLVLQKATHFTGCSFSSFTMNIAFKRHLMTEGINTRQWQSPGDRYSTMIGRFESWYGDWQFMYECMWP